jgi:dihydrodipicolinate synthase/N-acetylneuraminate lyase
LNLPQTITTKNRSAGHPIADLRGILLPVTTPFDCNGQIAIDALRTNIQQWNRTGVSGYVALGSTGERAHLDEREYLAVIETARAEVPSGSDRLTFIVGAGHHSTLKTVAEIRLAAASGADAVLVLTPHYYKAAMTQEVLREHYLAVADASPVPIILYSMPALTGIKIAPQTVAFLSEHQNIIGIKDSSADIEEFRGTVELVQPGFAMLTGNGTVLRDALVAGADGGILAVGCVVPELCLEIFRAVREGDGDRAATLQDKLTPLAAAVTTKYGIGGLKAALEMIGYKGGSVRAPLRAPGTAACEEISQLLQSAQSAFRAQVLETH